MALHVFSVKNVMKQHVGTLFDQVGEVINEKVLD